MAMSLVITEQTSAIATVSLNRPEKLNAINADLVEAFYQALLTINADPDIKVIILKGNGKAFCAGADLTGSDLDAEPNEPAARKEIERLQDITRQLLSSNKIVIGAIHGWAVGAGMEWALNCDFPIWAQSAKGFFPEAQWGLSVTGGVSAILPAMVGPAKAKELILLGEKHSADELYRLGIAWRVVPDDQLMDEATTLAQTLAKLHSRSLGDLKQGINLGAYGDIDKVLAFEIDATVAGACDRSTLENIKSFAPQ